MSGISRRNFMKCAGAAALAVAASGVLAGCGDTMLDVKVTFVYNGKQLPVTGTGKVKSGEQNMDTATVVLPAEYQEKYEIRDKTAEVVREIGSRTAIVELVAKNVTWQVSYRLDGKHIHGGSVMAAAQKPVITVDMLHTDEAALKEMFYQIPKNADIKIEDNTVIVPVEKIMGTVSVEYWFKGFSESHWKNGKYDEKLSIWKGESSFSKSQLKNLWNACHDSDSLNEKNVPSTFAIDWSDPTVKVYLSY